MGSSYPDSKFYAKTKQKISNGEIVFKNPHIVKTNKFRFSCNYYVSKFYEGLVFFGPKLASHK